MEVLRYMDFGEQIKKIRKKENLTQEQFAVKLNVSGQALSKWENNKNLPDIGMLASFDPVALDQACVDLCQKAEPIRNSQLGDNMASEHFHDHGDVWHNSNPNVSWAETLEHAQKIGIGSREYELITMK